MLFHISVEGTRYVTTGSDENNIDRVISEELNLSVSKKKWGETWTRLRLLGVEDGNEPEVQKYYLDRILSLGVKAYIATPLLGVKTFRRKK